MKRNESVLVYAVTGLLLVILLVAVVFGSQPAVAKQTDEKVAQLPGVAPVLMGKDRDALSLSPSPGTRGTAGVATSADRDPNHRDPNHRDPNGPGVGKPASTQGPAHEGGEDPIVNANLPNYGPRQLPPPSGPVSLSARIDLPSQRLEALFGPSRREGDYRFVNAWQGATLHRIVARWCGNTDRLEDVRTLNETLGSRLGEGDEILVPWVDAETLIAAHQARVAAHKKIDWAKGEAYELRKGDSLWKVASQRVATNMIPAWLERFKTLNPEIHDLSALVEGQSVRLPRHP